MTCGINKRKGCGQAYCRGCGKYIENDGFDKKFRNEISKREWLISGLCQECQDKIFGVD